MTDPQDMEAVLEAILFVTSEPVSSERMLGVFTEREREAAARALERVLDRYRPGGDAPSKGVMLDEVGGGLRLVTRPELHGYLKRFFDLSGTNRLSMAALETLAIVAYRQPITGPEIHELRDKNSAGVLHTLLERRLIRISGRKDVVGRPFVYSTTREFLLHFGLRRIEDLPPLEEFEDSLLSEGEFPAGDGEVSEDREEGLQRQLALLDDVERDQETDDSSDDTSRNISDDIADDVATPPDEPSLDLPPGTATPPELLS